MVRMQKMIRLKLGSKLLALKLNAWFEDLHQHKGITNETPDKMYVPFWDFVEDVYQPEVYMALTQVQEEWGLSTIHIIQTTPKLSFRAFCFDKVEWREYIGILADTDLLDPSYLRHTVMRGRAVIRITEKDGTKNKWINSIHSSSRLRYLSQDHANFFSKMYGIPGTFFPQNKIRLKGSIYESFR